MSSNVINYRSYYLLSYVVIYCILITGLMRSSQWLKWLAELGGLASDRNDKYSSLRLEATACIYVLALVGILQYTCLSQIRENTIGYTYYELLQDIIVARSRQNLMWSVLGDETQRPPSI